MIETPTLPPLSGAVILLFQLDRHVILLFMLLNKLINVIDRYYFIFEVLTGIEIFNLSMKDKPFKCFILIPVKVTYKYIRKNICDF